MQRHPLVAVQEVSREYSLGEATVHALRGVTLTVEAGEFVCIAGPSGSGKTTLLNLVGCLDHPTRGSVLVDGTDIGKLSDAGQSDFRNLRLGFVFQSFNLIPVLNVFENVEFPLLFRTGRAAPSARQRRTSVEEIVDAVGLTAVVDHRPTQLSGGQQQRVAIARALVTRPKLVLADELTANLDSENAERILSLMGDLNRRTGTTFVFATHDPQVVEHAKRLVTLRDGRVVDDRAKAPAVAGGVR